MSMISVVSLPRITAPKLAEMLLASINQPSSADTSSVAVVDVRDDDHIGGHIKSSLHFPSTSLDATLPTLLRRLADKDVVVFHCALSQQRGPAAALRYLREKAAKEQAEGEKAAVKQAGGEGGEEKKSQQVYVLDKGFVGWQEIYGPDERLTEAYRKELWEDGC